MRRISDVIAEYDTSNETERKKVILIKWFQKYPDERFDRSEVHQKLPNEWDVGQDRTAQLLNKLVDENILQSYGDQRIAYELADDIQVPVRYRIKSAMKHLYAIFDINRWGIAGVVINSTLLWTLLTLPFWFLSAVLLISPIEHIGSFSQSELFGFTVGMTVWWMLFLLSSFIFVRVRQWRV